MERGFSFSHNGIFVWLTASQIVTFSGNDYIRVRVRPTWTTHTNDISVRFKTREQDGLLFTTSNNRNQDFLRALMDRGRVRVIHNIGGDERVSPTRRLWCKNVVTFPTRVHFFTIFLGGHRLIWSNIYNEMEACSLTRKK